MLRIRHGSSSMTMYRFTLSSRISACSHDMAVPARGYGGLP